MRSGQAVVNSISDEEGVGNHPRGPDRAPPWRGRRGDGRSTRSARPIRSRARPRLQARLRHLGRRGRLSPEDNHLPIRISFAIGLGWKTQNNYGVDFIEATRWDPAEPAACAYLPGGVSNLSFSFRGNEPVREAMHSVFL